MLKKILKYDVQKMFLYATEQEQNCRKNLDLKNDIRIFSGDINLESASHFRILHLLQYIKKRLYV